MLSNRPNFRDFCLHLHDEDWIVDGNWACALLLYGDRDKYVIRRCESNPVGLKAGKLQSYSSNAWFRASRFRAVQPCRAVPYRVRVQAVQPLLLGPVARQAQEGGAPGA